MRTIRLLLVGALVGVAIETCADDKWDLASFPDDTASGTPNTLVHGDAQTHDLEGLIGSSDRDYFRIRVRARQSYEVRTHGSSVNFGDPCPVPMPSCAYLSRTDSSGGTLQDSAPLEGDPRSRVIRFTAAATATEYIRVSAEFGNNNDEYTIDMLNTTLFAPRFNNSATQTTILLLQNTAMQAVSGSVDLWSTAGTLLQAEPFNIPARGVLVLNTAALPGAAGQSGSASISHDGSYTALTGKAVALEPATGFTFDTAITPVPR
jgi:hypothetical protein